MKGFGRAGDEGGKRCDSRGEEEGASTELGRAEAWSLSFLSEGTEVSLPLAYGWMLSSALAPSGN